MQAYTSAFADRWQHMIVMSAPHCTLRAPTCHGGVLAGRNTALHDHHCGALQRHVPVNASAITGIPSATAVPASWYPELSLLTAQLLQLLMYHVPVLFGRRIQPAPRCSRPQAGDVCAPEAVHHAHPPPPAELLAHDKRQAVLPTLDNSGGHALHSLATAATLYNRLAVLTHGTLVANWLQQ